MLRRSGAPKPVYNAAKLFSMMEKIELPQAVTDDQVAVQAAIAPDGGRLTLLVLNYAESYSVERLLRVSIANIPEKLRGGTVRRWAVDKDHSNWFNDPGRAELEQIATSGIPKDGSFSGFLTTPANSITLLELVPKQ